MPSKFQDEQGQLITGHGNLEKFQKSAMPLICLGAAMCMACRAVAATLTAAIMLYMLSFKGNIISIRTSMHNHTCHDRLLC